MEPPLPPLDNTPYPCPRCAALIVGRLPFCPNCKQALSGAALMGYAVPPSGSTVALYFKIFGAALKMLVAIMLAFVAGAAGLMSVLGAIASTQGNTEGHLNASLLEVAFLCFLVVAGCIVGLKALFQKRP